MKLTNLPHSRTIGTFYLVFAMLAGLVGVGLSLALRFELTGRNIAHQLVPEFLLPFLSSGHALIMLLFMMIPALFCGFANWLIPMMIGHDDMQFKWLNLLALALLLLGFLIVIGVVVSSSTLAVAAYWLIGVLHIIAISFLLTSFNFIATILTARAPFMKLQSMPPFVWSVLVASFLMVVCLPIMTAAATMHLISTLATMTTAIDPVTLPVMLPVMMWFFAHPELLVLTLPAFGIISQVIATFCGGNLVAPRMVKGAFVLMGVLGFMLWGQTILNNGANYADKASKSYFLASLLLMALPVSCVLGSWLLTIWRGRCAFQVPMLWAAGFISMLLVAFLTGLSLFLSGTFEIAAFVGHFHYILGLSSIFAIFAGWYFWFGKISGYQIRDFSGKLHFWTMFVAVHLTFLPQHFGYGIEVPNSSNGAMETLIGWRNIATLGACLSALSLIVFFYAIVEAFIRQRPEAANPWGAAAFGGEAAFGTGTTGLEWRLDSPPSPQKDMVLIKGQ